MENFPEFFSNNLFLCSAFIIVLFMTVRAEILYRSNRHNELNPTEAIRFMNNESAVIIDVSPAADFKKGHIKDAINVPVSELANRLSELEAHKGKAVLAYCQAGSSSNRACKILRQAEFTNVRSLSGGLRAWSEANLPVSNTKK